MRQICAAYILLIMQRMACQKYHPGRMHVHIKHRMHRQRLHAWVVMRQTCTHLTKHARGDISKIPSCHPAGKKLNYDVVCGVAVSPSPPPPKQSCEVDMTLKNLSRPSTTDPQHCFGRRGGAEIDSGPIVVKFLVGLTASMCTSSIPCTSFGSVM